MTRMKESGIDWIGQIPEEWNLGKVKFFSKISAGATPDRNNIFFWNGDINWMSSGEVNQEVVTHTAETITNLALKRTSTKLLPIGTVMLALNGQGKTKGTAAVLAIETASNQSLASFIVDDASVNNIYLYYFFKANYCNIRGLKGEDRDGLNLQLVSNILIPLLDIKEQKKIADFLDKKTAQLDKVKALLEEQIQKLKDYRASLVYETVTKGLDKTVPMKDSGIDWIGQVPEGWEIGRVKDAFKLRSEKNFCPIEEVQLLSLYTEFGVFPHGDREEKGNKAVSTEGYKIVYKKDIVVNIILAWMGSIGISEYDGVTSPAYDIYEPLEGVCSKFFHYLFRTEAFSGQCYKYGKGIMKMRWRTYSDDFKTIEIPIPDYNSQVNIVKFLDDKLKIINQLIDNKQAQIENINKQRQTLIYDYVTGKRRG